MDNYTIYAGGSKKKYLSDWSSIAAAGDNVGEFLNHMFDSTYRLREVEIL